MTMRPEGRLSPQRLRRLRTEKRVLPKLFLTHPKPAKAGTENRQPEKQETPSPPDYPLNPAHYRTAEGT
jgi:hypothetical protein